MLPRSLPFYLFLCICFAIGIWGSAVFFGSQHYRTTRIAFLFETVCLEGAGQAISNSEARYLGLKNKYFGRGAFRDAKTVHSDKRSRTFIVIEDDSSCHVKTTSPFYLNHAEIVMITSMIQPLKEKYFPELQRDLVFEEFSETARGWFLGERWSKDRWGLIFWPAPSGDDKYELFLSYMPENTDDGAISW